MGHLDRTIADFDTFRSLTETGCYLEWDLFGNESSHYPLSDLDMPSDSQRMDIIKRVIDELDCNDRVVMAHDICTRHRQIKYGGHGYGHIFENIVPRMRRRGYTDDQVTGANAGERGEGADVCVVAGVSPSTPCPLRFQGNEGCMGDVGRAASTREQKVCEFWEVFGADVVLFGARLRGLSGCWSRPLALRTRSEDRRPSRR